MPSAAGTNISGEVVANLLDRFGQRGGAALLTWIGAWRTMVGLPDGLAGSHWGVTIPSPTGQRVRVNVGAQPVMFFTQEADDQDWMLVAGLVTNDEVEELAAELDDAGELIDRVDDWHADVLPSVAQTWLMVDARVAPALLEDDRFVRASASLVERRVDRPLAYSTWSEQAVLDLVLQPPDRGSQRDERLIQRVADTHAEQVVRNWLESEGCTWTRVTRWDGFDYEARQGDVDFRVEMKGTTQRQPAYMSFTPNQVARSRGELYCVLAVVHGIVVDDDLEPSGGELLLIDPWEPTDDELSPVAVRYGINYADDEEDDAETDSDDGVGDDLS